MKVVLLIDDSITMLNSLRSTLEIGGFAVETASDGQAALERLQQGVRPDVVITDINMPRMDGLTFIQEARKIIRFTPILALTTESQRQKRDKAKQYGATGWLVKPITGTDLLLVLRRLLPVI